MKKCFVVGLFIFILAIPISFANETSMELRETLNNMEFVEETQISKDEGHLYIQLNLTFQDEKMIYYYQDIIEKSYKKIPSKSITLLVYSDGFPLFKIKSIQNDIVDYIQENLNRNEYVERLAIEDIRSIEHVLLDELNLFDANIVGISVNESETIIQLESMKTAKSFQDDLMAMALTIIENTPWIDTLSFEFFKDDELIMTISGNKDDFLMTIEGSMSEDEFIDFLDIQVSEENEGLVEDVDTLNKIEELPLINVASGEINEVIDEIKVFELEVLESKEYYFKIKNFDVSEVKMFIKDESMNTIDDNIRESEMLEYIYIDLTAGKEYFLVLEPPENSVEKVEIGIEEASSMLPILIAILVILIIIVVMIVKVLKKKK